MAPPRVTFELKVREQNQLVFTQPLSHSYVSLLSIRDDSYKNLENSTVLTKKFSFLVTICVSKTCLFELPINMPSRASLPVENKGSFVLVVGTFELQKQYYVCKQISFLYPFKHLNKHL